MADIIKPHINHDRLFYIHHGLMTSYQGIFNWFLQDYFTDFKYATMATHDRAIEEIKNYKCNTVAGSDSGGDAGEGTYPDALPLPAISFNPLGDIAPDPNFLHLWRFRQIGVPGANMLVRPYEYEDDYFAYNIIRTRFRGNLELVMWFESVYEYVDHKIMMQMWFHGGQNRRVRINHINTYVIVPASIIETAYQGFQYDWSNTDLSNQLIKVLNQDKYLLPVVISPQIWMTSLTDASVIYGGDSLSEYKLQVTMEYDIDLPTYMIIKNNDSIESVKTTFEFDIGTSRPEYEIEEENTSGDETYVPKNKFDIWPENVKGPGKPKYVPAVFKPYMHVPEIKNRICSGEDSNFYRALSYEFISSVNENDGFIINLDGETISNENDIIVGDRTGELVYGTTFKLDGTGQNIIVNIDVDAGTFWDIFLFS